jgi:uroporphyrinogen III methyltransferase/synthase
MVILMGVESLQAITKKLIEGGLNPETPSAIIESGTLKNQRTIIGKIGTLAKDAEEKQVKPPAVIVIGEVANLGRKLAWFKKPPA